MLLKVDDRPLLKTRLSRDTTLLLEDEYRTFIENRNKTKYKQTDSENEQELMYALLVSYLDSYIQNNTYTIGAAVYIYFMTNTTTLSNFYSYYETSDYSFEKYTLLFVKELVLTLT